MNLALPGSPGHHAGALAPSTPRSWPPRSGQPGHRVSPATGVGLRYGLRPLRDRHGLSQTMTITRWPFHIQHRHAA